MPAPRQVESEYFAILNDLLPVLYGVWETTPVTAADVDANPLLLATRVVMSRQWESLLTTRKLCEHELGHVAVSFVRHACDEWLGSSTWTV